MRVAGRSSGKAERSSKTALDIQPHRAWTGADAGGATYQGRRQITDDIEAVLLERGGETLVMVVTPAQAARASTWNVGDTVRVDDRGRFHDHRTAEQDLNQDIEQDLAR